MKGRKRHLSQVNAGLTRMTKREEKAKNGYGRSGNVTLDAYRRENGLLAAHVKD